MLLPAAALGDRCGRRSMFTVGLALLSLPRQPARWRGRWLADRRARRSRRRRGAVIPSPRTRSGPFGPSAAGARDLRDHRTGRSCRPVIGGAVAEGSNGVDLLGSKVPIGLRDRSRSPDRGEVAGPALDIGGFVWSPAARRHRLGPCAETSAGWEPEVVAALALGAALLAASGLGAAGARCRC